MMLCSQGLKLSSLMETGILQFYMTFNLSTNWCSTDVGWCNKATTQSTGVNECYWMTLAEEHWPSGEVQFKIPYDLESNSRDQIFQKYCWTEQFYKLLTFLPPVCLSQDKLSGMLQLLLQWLPLFPIRHRIQPCAPGNCNPLPSTS